MTGYLARTQWRAHWRSHVLFTLAVAVSTAVVIATLSAASRSRSAFDRLRGETSASDASVFYDGGPEDADTARAALAAQPGVLGVDVVHEMFVRPLGSDLFPDFQLLAVAREGALDDPVIRQGRAPRPDRSDEIAVSESTARSLGVRVGDRLTLESMTDEWIDVAFNGGDPGEPDGPRVEVAVVGIARTPADFSRLQAVMFLTPAFADRYGDQMRVYTYLQTRLAPDALAAAQATGRLGDYLVGEEVNVSPFGDAESTDDGLATIATALQLVAAAAALSGAAAIGLIALRVSRAALQRSETLGAMGMTRAEQTAVAFVVLVPAAISGVLAGAVAGVLGEPLALRGLARAVDPSPTSVRLAGALVGAAAVGALAVILGIIAVAARATTRRSSAGAAKVAPGWPLQRPVWLVLGTRDALFATPDRGGRANRTALVVGAAGVAIAISALVVSSSIVRLENDPALTGQGAGRAIDAGENIDAFDDALERLSDDDRVAMLAELHVVFDVVVDDGASPGVLAFDVHRGDLGASIVKGRLPTVDDEVALGPATLDDIDRAVGDTVTLEGPAGRGEYEIVGVTLFPEGDYSHDDGVAMVVDGANELVGDVRDSGVHQVIYDWAEGIDAAAADDALLAEGFSVFTNDSALVPAAVTNLAQVVAFPRFLAAFVGVLALLTLAHAALTAVRGQANKLGTLRAIGLTGRSSAAVIAVQVGVLALGSVIIGVPLGLAGGRVVWRPIAEGAHVVVRTVWSAPAVSVVVVVALGFAALLAAVSSFRAARLPAARFLRTE